MTTQQNNTELRKIVEEFSIAYYSCLEELCHSVEHYIEQYNSRELFVDFFSHCNYLLKETRAFIAERQSVYLPYFRELSEKSTTGHDCANCSGKCDMQHNMRMLELTTTLGKMRSTSLYIQTELSALSKANVDNSRIAVIKAEVAQLNNTLNDLFVAEETLLFPAVGQAQKSINAHS